ncbi:MAG: hypothetical protein ACPGGK_08180 [Pikeienuella sp.]
MNRFFKALTAVVLMQVGTAQAANEVILPAPEIEDPSAYVERKLKEFQDRLAALKEQRQNLGDEGPFDGVATAEAILKSLSNMGPRDLVLTVDGDSSVFDKLPPFDPGDQAFAVPVIPDTTTPLGRAGRSLKSGSGEVLFAVDPDTAAVFSLNSHAALELETDVIILRPAGTCCLKYGTAEDASGKTVCAKSVDVFKTEVQRIDLRSMLGLSPVDASLSAINMATGDQGEKLSVPAVGPGSVTLTYNSGLRRETTQCGTKYNSVLNRRDPKFVLIGGEADTLGDKATLNTRGILFKSFGLPGLDVKDGSAAPQLDHFKAGRTSHGSLEMAEAAIGEMPKPIASYADGDGDQFNGLTRFRGVLTAETSGVGPVRTLGSRIDLARGAAPGASTVTWTLNNVARASHKITMNAVNVELREVPFDNALNFGREYEAVVAIDGPVDFEAGGYEISWGGDVFWSSANGRVEATEGRTEIINRFRAEGITRPVMEIAMTSPFGDVFNYDAGFIVTGRVIGSMEMRGVRGQVFSAVNDVPRVDQIDTFFPSVQPSNPAHVSTSVVFINDNGEREALQTALSRVGVRAGLPDGLMTSSNSGFMKRVQKSVSGSFQFAVEPKIGAAEVVSVLSESTGVPQRLTGGAARSLSAEPILVTSNALRLLRENDGFTLSVRGPADMTRYKARWTRRGFGPTETPFVKGEDGFVAKIETEERLARVEVIEGPEVVATLLGVMAALPARIEILPFRKAAQVVNKTAVEDFGGLSGQERECRESTAFGVLAMGLDTGGLSVKDFCAGERAADRVELKQRREDQKDRNRFLQGLDRAGKKLVELAAQMEVAAAIQGAPAPELGETVCVWSIIGAGPPLAVAQRVTNVRREAEGDFCFNIVTGVKQGFTPGAEIRVELQLLDTSPVPIKSVVE